MNSITKQVLQAALIRANTSLAEVNQCIDEKHEDMRNLFKEQKILLEQVSDLHASLDA